MKHNAPLDLLRQELRQAVIQNLTGSPASPVVGQIYTDTTAGSGNEIFYMYIGSGWAEIAFMTRVLSKRLDQFSAPNVALGMNNQRLTGLADPTAAQDAATRAYVDALVNGTDWKASVRIATTANDTLSGLAARDGVTPVANDRVAVIAQTTGSANGIYVAAAGAWTRATDTDSTGEVTAGMAFFVSEGTANGNTQWKMTTDDPITIGTTALVFAQIGAATTYTAGSGIAIAGSVISTDKTITPAGYSATFGDAVATSFNIDHNLNSVRKLKATFMKESS